MKKFGAKYLIRLDDACPTMDIKKWEKFEILLEKYGIKPIIAVIPNNKNEKLKIDPPDPNFWNKVRQWQDKGWCIALHGYDHVFINNSERSLVPLNSYSEFAGVELELQKNKIRHGINILKREKVFPTAWVAPAHSFDKNTLLALKEESNIRVISDGFAFTPFKKGEFTWVPQQLWGFCQKRHGIWTGCFHPNTISEENFLDLQKFVAANYECFTSINEVITAKRNRSLIDKAFHTYTFLKRDLKNKKKSI